MKRINSNATWIDSYLGVGDCRKLRICYRLYTSFKYLLYGNKDSELEETSDFTRGFNYARLFFDLSWTLLTVIKEIWVEIGMQTYRCRGPRPLLPRIKISGFNLLTSLHITSFASPTFIHAWQGTCEVRKIQNIHLQPYEHHIITLSWRRQTKKWFLLNLIHDATNTHKIRHIYNSTGPERHDTSGWRIQEGGGSSSDHSPQPRQSHWELRKCCPLHQYLHSRYKVSIFSRFYL